MKDALHVWVDVVFRRTVALLAAGLPFVEEDFSLFDVLKCCGEDVFRYESIQRDFIMRSIFDDYLWFEWSN